jgi:FSR family fosmidomycin resistance protein-like MFS transporter
MVLHSRCFRPAATSLIAWTAPRAFIVVPRGQGSIAWFSICAIVALILLWRIGHWYAHLHLRKSAQMAFTVVPPMTRGAKRTVAILLALVFSKYVYLMSLSSYFMFFLIDRFHISVDSAQLYLFAFLEPSRPGPSPEAPSAIALAGST